MEFEGSCPQDAVGVVVLKGLSLNFSINKGERICILWSVLDLQVFGTWMYRYCPLFMELKVHLQIIPHKSERWKHGSTNFQNWHLQQVFVLTDTVHALIRTSFGARLMAALLGDIYPAVIPCWPPFACTDRLLLLLLTRTGDCLLEGLNNLYVSQKIAMNMC